MHQDNQKSYFQRILLGEAIHNGVWASLQVLAECVKNIHPISPLLGNQSGLLFVAINQDAICSNLEKWGTVSLWNKNRFALKAVASSRSMFVGCNTILSTFTWTAQCHCFATRRTWETDVYMLLMPLAVPLNNNILCLWPKSLKSSVSIHETVAGQFIKFKDSKIKSQSLKLNLNFQEFLHS